MEFFDSANDGAFDRHMNKFEEKKRCAQRLQQEFLETNHQFPLPAANEEAGVVLPSTRKQSKTDSTEEHRNITHIAQSATLRGVTVLA